MTLVTGGGGGIGRATAGLLAREGAAAVVVADVSAAAADETIALLDLPPGRGLALAVDVSDPSAANKMVDDVVSAFGRIDCAVNNAAVSGGLADLTDVTDEDWQRIHRINLDGVFHCLRAELRAMCAAESGAIVNLSSATILDPKPGLGPYVSTKSGVFGLTSVAAGEGAAYNVRVNAVLPGPTRTTMYEAVLAAEPGLEERVVASIPLGRLGLVDDIAEAIVWLCSPRSAYVTATRILVDGGLHSVGARPRRQP